MISLSVGIMLAIVAALLIAFALLIACSLTDTQNQRDDYEDRPNHGFPSQNDPQ